MVIHLHVIIIAFVLQQNRVVGIGTVWLTMSNIFTFWSFTEQIDWSLVYLMICPLWQKEKTQRELWAGS